MKIYEVEIKYADYPAKLESCLYDSLRKYGRQGDYTFVALPITSCIDKFDNLELRDFSNTQKIVNNILQLNLRNPFFVTQHFLADYIDFGKALVFSAHASFKNNFLSIPHYTFKQIDGLNFFDRQYICSFVGSFNTTRDGLRGKLKSKNKNVKILNIGPSYFRNTEKTKYDHIYSDVMSNSKTVLCPKGCGPNSIRIWETLYAGAVPLIISDDLKLPLEDKIDWSKFSIRIPENAIDRFEDYLPDEKVLFKMSLLGNSLYKKYFSNEKLYSVINFNLTPSYF